MKTRGFEPRFSQNLTPVSREKPQNLYLAYISHLFSKPYLLAVSLTANVWKRINWAKAQRCVFKLQKLL